MFVVLKQMEDSTLPQNMKHWATRSFGSDTRPVHVQTLLRWYRTANKDEKSAYASTSIKTFAEACKKYGAEQPGHRPRTTGALRTLYNKLQAMQAQRASQAPVMNVQQDLLITEGPPSALSVVHILRCGRTNASRFENIGDIAGFSLHEWQTLYNAQPADVEQELGYRHLHSLRQVYSRLSQEQLNTSSLSKLEGRIHGPVRVYRMLVEQRKATEARGRQSLPNSRANSRAPSLRSLSPRQP